MFAASIVCQPFCVDRSARQEERLTLDPLRVVVVDDSPRFRELVISILHSRPGLHVIAEACDGGKAAREVEALRPDLVLLDIGLPTLNGFEVAQAIRKTASGSKIIFVSQESSIDVVEKALSLGASGYVLKSDAASDLLEALTSVVQGKQFLSKTLKRGDST